LPGLKPCSTQQKYGETELRRASCNRAADVAVARPAYAEAVANYDAAPRLLAMHEEGRVRDQHQLAI
jgi:hypothetical protein